MAIPGGRRFGQTAGYTPGIQKLPTKISYKNQDFFVRLGSGYPCRPACISPTSMRFLEDIIFFVGNDFSQG